MTARLPRMVITLTERINALRDSARLLLRRRGELALMPKGINTAHGISMRSTIAAARPTAS